MIEEAVITKILETGDMKTPETMGIDEDCFAGANNRLLYRALRRYWHAASTHGNVPTREWIDERYSIEYESLPQDLSALCVELLETHVRSRLMEICSEAVDRSHEEPMQAVFGLRDRLTKLEGKSAESEDLYLADSIAELKEWYKNTKERGGVTGIPYPWDSLTQKSGGMCDEQLLLFYGRPKQLKTWVALDICVNAYLEYGKRILIFAWEQGPFELMRRVAALLSKIDYEKWKGGALENLEEERVWRVLESIRALEIAKEGRRDRPSLLICSSTDSRFGTGINAINGRIEDFEPDLVLADGIYNMADEKAGRRSLKWENQAEIISSLKLSARRYKLPLLATTQANRGGEDPSKRGTDDIAFTDGAGMWSDSMIKVTKKKKKDGNLSLILDVRGAREYDMSGIKLLAKPATIFDEECVLDSDDAVLEEVGGLPAEVEISRKKSSKINTTDIADEAAKHIERNEWD